MSEHTESNHELYGPKRHNAPGCPRCKLNAAAPDLLTACRMGIKYLDGCNSGIGLESEKQNKTAFRRMLDAAITKAVIAKAIE